MVDMEDGTPDCVSCKSYRVYKGKCESCGTVQKEWYKKNMIENLEKYGFKKSFFFKKWNYKDMIIAKPIKGSTNMLFTFGDKEIVFMSYGSFNMVKLRIDNILSDKKTRRNVLIDNLLG